MPAADDNGAHSRTHVAMKHLFPLFAAALCGTAPALAADGLAPWSAGHGGEPPPPWHVSGLPHQSKPFTAFSVERQGEPLLRIEADRSYGNLVHPLPPTREWHHLGWRWQVDEPLAHPDLHERSGEDSAVHVCVMFDMPTDRLPAFERALLSVTRSSSGEPVPSATVCYVWDTTLPPGTALHSPFTNRLRWLVLRGTGTPLHQMESESRDLDADFKRLFGEESDSVPPVIGVAVGADADNTRGHSVAHVGALQLRP